MVRKKVFSFLCGKKRGASKPHTTAKADVAPAPSMAKPIAVNTAAGIQTLPGSELLPATPVRMPADITRAEIEQALGQSLDFKDLASTYSYYDMADIKQGWNDNWYSGCRFDPTDETARVLAPGEQNTDIPQMKQVLEELPAFRGFKLLMFVTIPVKQQQYPERWGWTKKRPTPMTDGVFDVSNVVLLADNGRIVTDPNAWFGTFAYGLNYEDGPLCFPHIIAHNAQARAAFVAGIVPRLARAIQSSR